MAERKRPARGEGGAAARKQAKVSTAVIRRLPRYYRHLSELQRKNVVRISSSALGRDMGLTASQIRQDLFCFGEFGQQGYGYKVDSLREEIGEILGISRGHTVVVLGAGNLGRALIENFKFSSNGFELLAAFDINEEVGTEIAGVPVYHIDQLEEFLRERPVSVGLLTVPKTAALPTAERLAAAGVHGIWNFTNAELPLPERSGVVVESVHFSDSLLTLSYMISQREAQEEQK
ncbi:MAG: redox-sensing transcriptional repressor Rex [Lawsonibacter sp.]|nr:redox-sensing transcriptional repressor Rex [Lawsonibacter sp.]